jgi:hypothetical protein
MSIFEQIDKDMIAAMKAGEKDKLTVLRGLKSDLKYKQIDTGKDLTDEQSVEVLSSAAKKRRDSIEQFAKGGRDDLVKKEQAELEIINSYLPKQLSEQELRDLVAAAIEDTGADSPQKIGLVMKALMPKVKGKADGKLVNKMVAEMLAK